MVWYDISEHLDKLKAGTNLFAIQGMNVDGSSPDFLIQAELVARKNYQNNFVSELPIIMINSDDNIPVNANTVRNGSINIINNGVGNDHRLTQSVNGFSGRLAITQNATIYDYPKNHYYLTLLDDLQQTVSASLLEFPEGDEWILYAPYNDKTLLRTVLMGEMAHQMGHGEAPKMCHLFLNDDYLGLYSLMPAQNQHPNRINIAAPGDEDDALTGGYILSLDKNRVAPGYDSPIAPFRNAPDPIRYLYEFPNADNLTAAQESYIQSAINSFETDIVNSIDLASAVDYFLLNEVSKNIDAYRDHSILYKDRDSVNPNFIIQSTLDYNNACGNTRKYQGNIVQGWQIDFLSNQGNVSSDSMFVPLWWQQLYESVEFTRALYKRWDVLQYSILSEDFVVEKLDSLYNLLSTDGVLNFERWPVAGKPIEPYGIIGETFTEDYDYLFIWMIDRLEWMGEAMLEFETGVAEEKQQLVSFELMQNYPNPFNPATTMSYRLPKTGHVSLKIYDVRGRLVAALVDAVQPAGEYSVTWNADGFASGVYFYEIKTGDFSQTKQMLLLQ